MGQAWNKAVRRETGMLPVWPVFNYIELGYVIQIDRGKISPLGRFTDVTGEVAPVDSVPFQMSSAKYEIQTENSVSVDTLASGTASLVFQGAPSAQVRLEVTFSKDDSAYGLANGLAGTQIASPLQLVAPIVRAYHRGEWHTNYFFVYALATAQAARFYEGSSRGSTFQLASNADIQVPTTGTGRAEITANLALTFERKSISKFEADNSVVFFRAYRVFDKRLIGLETVEEGVESAPLEDYLSEPTPEALTQFEWAAP